MTTSTAQSAEPTVEEALRSSPEWMEEIVRRHDYDSSTLLACHSGNEHNVWAIGIGPQAHADRAHLLSMIGHPTLSAEAVEIAQNLIANGGITKDQATHALEIVNAHVVTLARGALGLSVDRDRLLLAISEVHSGEQAEGEKIVDAVLGALRGQRP